MGEGVGKVRLPENLDNGARGAGEVTGDQLAGQFVTDGETLGSHLVRSFDVTYPHCRLTSLATAVTSNCQLEQPLRNTRE